MRRLLAALVVAALPGCATTLLWWGNPSLGRHESLGGATGGRAWCVSEARTTSGTVAGSPPLYVVELTYPERVATTAWVPTGAVGDGPRTGEAVGVNTAVPRDARLVALRTTRTTADGRAADVMIVDGGVAFVISAEGSRWVPQGEDGSTVARVLLTPLAVVWDLGTLPLQLVILGLLR